MVPKLYTPSTLRQNAHLYRACCLMTLRQSFLQTQISKNDVNSRSKRTGGKSLLFLIWDWRPDGRWKYWFCYLIFVFVLFCFLFVWDALVDFSCKVYLPVNTRVTKIAIWHTYFESCLWICKAGTGIDFWFRSVNLRASTNLKPI